MSDGTGASVSTSGYLATFTFVAAEGAQGEFEIAVLEGPYSFLTDATGKSLGVEPGECEVVGYGIDCYMQSHCDDNNECTTDACASNECGYANVAASTPCDDGLWCTLKSTTCDGNGNCTGGIPRCDPGEICDEPGQVCIAEQ